MKVHLVRNEVGYKNIMSEDRTKLTPLLSRMNNPIGDFAFPSFYVSTPKASVSNFYPIGYELLAFDEIARNALWDVIGEAGEHYSVEVEDVGTLSIFNVTETCDALDHDKSVWREEDDGEKYVVLKHVFNPERIVGKSCLFKIAENRYSKILCVTGAPNQQGDFYTRYHEAGLTGLKFTELWSDEGQ